MHKIIALLLLYAFVVTEAFADMPANTRELIVACEATARMHSSGKLISNNTQQFVNAGYCAGLIQGYISGYISEKKACGLTPGWTYRGFIKNAIAVQNELESKDKNWGDYSATSLVAEMLSRVPKQANGGPKDMVLWDDN